MAAQLVASRAVLSSTESVSYIHVCVCVCVCVCARARVKLQLGFSPVAVVQQYNRQVTQITHKQSTNTKHKNTTINDTTTANK
jgi:hypothetical protein